jgi:hypothetical protein
MNLTDLSGLSAHRSSWKGDELLRRPDWLTELTERDNDEVHAALLRDLSSHSDSIGREAFTLPGLGSKLEAIQDSLEHGSGAAMLRGLRLDGMDEADCRTLFRGISLYIGTPISQSADGELIFSVRDAGFAEIDPRARGPNTRKRLTYHTDRCDVIGFMCLQQAKSGGESYVVSSMKLFNEIRSRRPDLLEVLMQPFYYARHTVDLGNEKPWCQQPIFSIFEGHFAANMLRVLIDRAYAMAELPDLSEIQREALDYVQELAENPAFHVTFMQRPGDILFLNNWVTLHRRSEFEDYDEPERKRHLLRIWLSVPNSRPLDPTFKDNYGATKAGAIRGGMRKC